MARGPSGHLEQLPSGGFRVDVYAGTDPLTGRRLRYRQTVKTVPAPCRAGGGRALGRDIPQRLVILSGPVSSWAAHDHAVAAAWSAVGVTDVDDRIGVEYSP